jgi:hypothetical protein
VTLCDVGAGYEGEGDGEIPKTYCNLHTARLSALGQVRSFGSELLAAAFRYRYKYQKPQSCNTPQMPILSLKNWSQIIT